MAKTVIIHQPDFLPYLGFFHRLLKADLYVVLDSVQFVRSSRSWHKRDKIRTESGETWLSVGVRKSNRCATINTIELCDETEWRSRHLNLIRHHYRTAPYFDEIFPCLEQLYSLKCRYLVEFNLASIQMLMELFAIQLPLVYSSDLSPSGKSNELLVDILRKVGAIRYLSGIGAKAYYQAEPFEQAGITVAWQNFKHPVYRQQYSGFVPYLSSIDMLLNCGVHHSRQILRRECDP